jgi:hypothetical protein
MFALLPGKQTANTTSSGSKCQPIHWDTPYFKLVIAMTRDEYKRTRSLAVRAGLYRRENAKMGCVDVAKETFSPSPPKTGTFAKRLTAPESPPQVS